MKLDCVTAPAGPRGAVGRVADPRGREHEGADTAPTPARPGQRRRERADRMLA
jgi:hypothetical protein